MAHRMSHSLIKKLDDVNFYFAASGASRGESVSRRNRKDPASCRLAGSFDDLVPPPWLEHGQIRIRQRSGYRERARQRPII